MLSKKNRISKDEFPAPREQGFRVFSPLLTAVFYQNTHDHKAAVVVSKKLAKTAVVRNRMRRRVYAALSPLFEISKKVTVIVYPKKETEKAPFQRLQDELGQAFQKAKLL